MLILRGYKRCPFVLLLGIASAAPSEIQLLLSFPIDALYAGFAVSAINGCFSVLSVFVFNASSLLILCSYRRCPFFVVLGIASAALSKIQIVVAFPD